MIEDLTSAINAEEWKEVQGVYIRTKEGQLAVDGQLKLRIANGLHTAMCHVAAMAGINNVYEAMQYPAIAQYLDELYQGES